MRGARPQSGPPNELRPLNLYDDHGNAKQTLHPPAGLQTASGYIPIQGRPVEPQPHDHRRPPPPNDPSQSNSQDVRFMDGAMDPYHDESLPLQVAFGEEQNQWPLNANVITYELRDSEEGAKREAPSLAVITRAIRGNLLKEREMECQEEYSSDETPHLSDLEWLTRTARRTIKALERENEILKNGPRGPIIHDLGASEMGEWEELGIPREEYEDVKKVREDKQERYDLWADLSSLKVDITFGQLLEISPMARKTLKEGMLVTRQTRKLKTIVAARVQL